MKIGDDMNQNKRPLYEALKLHDKKNPLSLHVPGHKYGVISPEEGGHYFQEVMKLDATELNGLDDLHQPEGAILEAEHLLADLYQVEKSYLLVNGSTVGNLAMILATVKENDFVLVQRNCHKSILNGIYLAKAEPVFLDPEYHHEWGVTGGISIHTLEKAIQMYPNAKALILTYPNYYGMVYGLGSMIKLAHEHKIPVLIDEAHGAHFIAGSPFPKSAVTLGADIVVQSAHKTLPALTMGSYLHFNSQLLLKSHLEKYLHMLQSSSPSYLLMASLDQARSYLGTYEQEDRSYLLEQVHIFTEALQQIKEIKVLTYPFYEGDLLKVTIQSKTSLTGFDLQKSLENEGIYTELADPYNLLMVLPLLKNGMIYPFTYIIEKLNKVTQGLPIKEREIFVSPLKKKIGRLELSQRKQEVASKEVSSLSIAAGKICAESIIPYPPGIPILLPGELITTEDVETIQVLLNAGAKFQGSKHIYEGKLNTYRVEK